MSAFCKNTITGTQSESYSIVMPTQETDIKKTLEACLAEMEIPLIDAEHSEEVSNLANKFKNWNVAIEYAEIKKRFTNAVEKDPAKKINRDEITLLVNASKILQGLVDPNDELLARVRRRKVDIGRLTSIRVRKSSRTKSISYTTIGYYKIKEEYAAVVTEVFKESGYGDLLPYLFSKADTNSAEKLIDLTISKATSTSLIPIKGISKVMQAKLRSFGIFDVSGLLQNGITIAKRNSLAKKLCIDPKTVNTWVKQADLWRVSGMNTDLAYLLVLIGVRNPADLAKVDANIAYPLIENLMGSQVDFEMCTEEELLTVIENAAAMESFAFKVDFKTFKNQLLDILYAEENLSLDKIEKILNSQKVLDLGKNFEPSRNGISLNIETSDKEPTYLFSEDNISIDYEDSFNGKDICKALANLDDVQRSLPLPHTLSGSVKYKKTGHKNLEIASGYTIEVDGIVSPTADISQANLKPFATTDGEGKFIVVMPDRYCFKETVTFIIRKGSYKQKFIKSTSDILSCVDQAKNLDEFYNIDSLAARMNILSEKIKQHDEKIKLGLKINDHGSGLKTYQDELDAYKKEKEDLQNDFEESEKTLLEKYKPAADVESAYKIFLSKLTLKTSNATLDGTNLDNKNDEEPFIVCEEIFKEDENASEKTLPQVKLMGEDETAIRLSSNTTPSNVYSYSMLQRLVDPAINTGARATMKKAVDVDRFKKAVRRPNSVTQCVSLGMGYTLNMHQAWVPDGFALGNLLYSTVLAPGEEQRLIVRENTQNYIITDQSEGSDAEHEDYRRGQTDATSAILTNAINKLSQASSHSDYTTTTGGFGASAGIGFLAGAVAGLFGLSGSYSRSHGEANSNSMQSDRYNEVSTTAQNYQQAISSESNKYAQARRVSIQTASSEVTDSVATKIIANHNHSHAMTIQYWEVMRRYRLESCIDSIDLVLFVPLKLIPFLKESCSYFYKDSKFENFNKGEFAERYDALLNYSTVLKSYLPYKYRTGLNLIERYAAMPHWVPEKINDNGFDLTITVTGNFLSFDELSATLFLKNGKGSIAAHTDYNRPTWKTNKRNIIVAWFGVKQEIEIDSVYNNSKEDTKRFIQDVRNRKGDTEIRFTFTLPPDVNPDDLNCVRVYRKSEDLVFHPERLEKLEDEAYANMSGKYWDFCKDDDSSGKDLRRIAHYKEAMKLAAADHTLMAYELDRLGYPTIDAKIHSSKGGAKFYTQMGSNILGSCVTINIGTENKTLLFKDFQSMEETLHHVVSNTVKYSQAVWSSLSADERALMLEKYTIDMDFDSLDKSISIEDSSIDKSESMESPSLLNCVNVKKVIGFYGNCMLLPFTYPESLAKKLGKTAKDIQDALYKYHTNNFRAPTTTISMPTDGMVGEAVLGETNVSEKIDITRFWNWKDSPIDSMTLDEKYLNGNDYLSDKSTKDISALEIAGATQPTAVTAADLASALINRQQPTFNDITGIEQLKEVLNAGTTSAANGRDKYLETSADMAKAALNSATKAYEISQKQSAKGDSSGLKAAKKAVDDAVDTLPNTITHNSTEDAITREICNKILGKTFNIVAVDDAKKSAAEKFYLNEDDTDEFKKYLKTAVSEYKEKGAATETSKSKDKE